MEQRRRLIWVIDCPSPYNTHLLEAVAADPDIDLSVYFVKSGVESHPWQRNGIRGFSFSVLNRRKLIDWSFVRVAYRRDRPFMIVGGWSEPTLLLSLAFTRLPFALWTDTPRPRKSGVSLREFIRSAWLKRTLERATYVMGTGKPALKSLALMGTSPEKLVDFPYFVDLDGFARSRRPPRREHLVFVSSGRLESAKGFDLSLRALAEAYNGRPERFKYRIAGIGSCEQELRQLARTLGIEKSVEFLGWLEADQLPDLYDTGDVLLHPARVEPYGVTILEAMASGLVILASDQTNAAVDRIDHGVQGYLHKTGKAESLAEQIRAILVDELDLGKMQTAARSRAHEWPVSRGVSIVKAMMQRSS
jgi:glycosyltransferase involved in cell wall biosynthesis